MFAGYWVNDKHIQRAGRCVYVHVASVAMCTLHNVTAQNFQTLLAVKDTVECVDPSLRLSPTPPTSNPPSPTSFVLPLP